MLQRFIESILIVSSAINCFRTITRIGIFRQVKISGVTTLVPIGIPTPPTKVSLNPGDSIEEPQETALSGKQVISFSYIKESKPELELEFSLAMGELESLLHGNVVGAGTNVNGYVYAEFNSASVPAVRRTGQIGYGVVAQGANSTAQVSYIDPTTKLAKPIVVEDVTGTAPTLTGDQATIGAHLLFTLSPELIAQAVEIHAWVPCVIPSASIITAQPLGLLTVFAQGVSFDDTARLVSARNCSRLAGGSIDSDPKRSIKLRILPDVADGTGLGYQILDCPLVTA